MAKHKGEYEIRKSNKTGKYFIARNFFDKEEGQWFPLSRSVEEFETQEEAKKELPLYKALK